MSYDENFLPPSLLETMESLDRMMVDEPINPSTIVAILYAYDQWKEREKIKKLSLAYL